MLSRTNETRPSINPDKTSSLEKKTSLKRKAAAGMLALTALVGVSACGGGEVVAKAGPVATAEQTAKPNQVVEASPTTNPNKNTEFYSQVVEKRNLMDVGQFELLPRDEQLVFAQYLIDQSVERGIYNQVYGPGKKNAEYAHTYTKATLSNTGQELLDNELFKQQISYIQFVEGEVKPYDPIDGQKILSAVYWDVNEQKSVTKDFTDTKHQEQTLTHITPLADKHNAVNTSELQNYTDVSGEVVPSKIVESTDNNNKVMYTRFVYHEFKDYKNETRADWYTENISESLAGLSQ